MQLLIEAQYIPDGTTVYKKTGDARFIIRDKLNIYAYGKDTGQPEREVKVAKDCKFMVDGRGNVNVVSGNTILKVDLISPPEDVSDDVYGIDLDLISSIIQQRLGENYEVYLHAEIPQ